MELVPLTTTEFPSFLKRTIQGFADECVDVGRWQVDEALAHSKKLVEADLPQGLETPNHHIFNLYDQAQKEIVGYVWLEVMTKDDLPTVFINDIEINTMHRRKGYASKAFELVELFAKENDINRVALHVFKSNTAAQALYQKLGFQVTGLNMLKNLDK